ncbi:hypothetical protein D3870_20550 [Noviherbaspirillum cavernae]|uniref:Uncharacterized protein n=1 Tax=Noviherbaspirillum cavernae TaxID=2320862 RepID=A0A418WW65_9BURK|nr:hypothetical protein [Noviherbaspirillum cavernae]RJF96781.1 hypothetical protein D3870_20550 [Noviherbaspirillum cavernae]
MILLQVFIPCHRYVRVPKWLTFVGYVPWATLVGVALGFTPMNPIKALRWSAVINDVISVVHHGDHDADGGAARHQGRLVITRRLKFLDWLCMGMMALAVFAMFMMSGA